MFGLGLLVKGALAVGKKLIGHHLVTGGALGAANGVENAVSGLGWRFFVGAGVTLYATQPEVRAAINALIGAVKDVIL